MDYGLWEGFDRMRRICSTAEKGWVTLQQILDIVILEIVIIGLTIILISNISCRRKF